MTDIPTAPPPEPSSSDDVAQIAALELFRQRVENEIASREPEDNYPFVEGNERALRCFILERLANSDIDGTILVTNMEMVYKWIESGDTPKKRRDHIKPVES